MDYSPCRATFFRNDTGPIRVCVGMTTAAATTVTACDPALLPDDAALLKAMLAEVLAALHSSRHESEQLRTRMDQLLRRLYGRRSERLDANQLLLFDLLPEAAADVTPPADVGDGDASTGHQAAPEGPRPADTASTLAPRSPRLRVVRGRTRLRPLRTTPRCYW